MIVSIIFIVLIVIYARLIDTVGVKYPDSFLFLGRAILVFFLSHLVILSCQFNEYENRLEERTNIVETLDNIKDHTFEWGQGAIMKDVLDFNQNLLEAKRFNNYFILSYYIDDRFMDMEPIK
jgi:hypothetical protein